MGATPFGFNSCYCTECLSHALIKAKMKGKKVDVLIDSGASGNFIDSKVAAELKITVHGEGSEINGIPRISGQYSRKPKNRYTSIKS